MNKRRTGKKCTTDDPEAAYRAALKTSLNILGYRDNTEAQVREKLSERGYTEETVNAVIEWLIAKRYLDDERMLLSAVRRLAEGRLYGKARIRQELRRKQFSPEAIASLDWDGEELAVIDFQAICLRLLQKRGGVRDEKTYAFLLRYGHSPADIRAAYRLLAEKSEGTEVETE